MSYPSAAELAQEWKAVSTVPWLFTTYAIGMVTLIFFIMKWLYGSTLAKARRNAVEDEKENQRLKDENARLTEAAAVHSREEQTRNLPIRFRPESITDKGQLINFLEEVDNRTKDVIAKSKDIGDDGPMVQLLFNHHAQIDKDRQAGHVMGRIMKKLSPEQEKSLRGPLVNAVKELHRVLGEFQKSLLN